MKKCMDRRIRTIGILTFLLAGIAVPGHFRAVSAEKKESVEARLQRLEDREEIRQLLMDYGRFLDQRDFASFSKLFAEKEGEWIGGMGRAKGTEAIRKLMDDTIGRDTSGQIAGPNRHLFTNEVIQVNGNEAKATTKWVFVVQNASKQPQPFYLGHYEDTFVREQGRWKFLRRTVYGDIPADDPLSRK
jgi:3-phenylpropionate/cinnamic acid dioxygenase small subunit